jgi:hypothetical protein
MNLVQHFTRLERQRSGRKWLLNETHAVIKHPVAHDRVVVKLDM